MLVTFRLRKSRDSKKKITLTIEIEEKNNNYKLQSIVS